MKARRDMYSLVSEIISRLLSALVGLDFQLTVISFHLIVIHQFLLLYDTSHLISYLDMTDLKQALAENNSTLSEIFLPSALPSTTRLSFLDYFVYPFLDLLLHFSLRLLLFASIFYYTICGIMSIYVLS